MARPSGILPHTVFLKKRFLAPKPPISFFYELARGVSSCQDYDIHRRRGAWDYPPLFPPPQGKKKDEKSESGPSLFDLMSQTTLKLQDTMVQNNQESRRKYWATRLSVCLIACIAHSFAGSALLASLTCSAVFAHLLPSSWESE